MGELETKQQRLEEQLSKLPSLIVAYSGGVDSAYLAYAAHHALGERMLAVTALSASYSARDREEAEKCVAHSHFPHEFICHRRAGESELSRQQRGPLLFLQG